MGVKGSRKSKLISTIEMEVAISKMLDIRKHVIVPNLSWGFDGMHECDMFIVRRSGYAFEIEIKRSKSDLLADFKKRHNHIDKQNRIIQLYYAIPKELLKKCEEHIPDDCGIILCEKYESNGKYYSYASFYREATRRKGCRKLTAKEQLKVATLGTMRIWKLKEKIITLQKNKS